MGGRGASLKKTTLAKIPKRRRWGANGAPSEDSSDLSAYKSRHESFIKTQLSGDESKSLRFYSKHGDELMNAILRNGLKTKAELKAYMKQNGKSFKFDDSEYTAAFKDIKHVKSAINKSKAITDKHITLSRGTSLAEFHVGSFDELTKLKGQTRHTEGFYSTTIRKDPPWHSGVIVHISKPAGVAGIHMESVSHFKHEQETLLNHGQYYYINDVKIENGAGHVYVTMVK